MSDGPIVAIRNLSKRLGKAQALDNVALDVHPGRIIGLLGTNGAGKSSLGSTAEIRNASTPSASVSGGVASSTTERRASS